MIENLHRQFKVFHRKKLLKFNPDCYISKVSNITRMNFSNVIFQIVHAITTLFLNMKKNHDSLIRTLFLEPNVHGGISAHTGELLWNSHFLECGVMTCSLAQSGFCLVSSQEWNLRISNTSDSLFLFLTVDPG